MTAKTIVTLFSCAASLLLSQALCNALVVGDGSGSSDVFTAAISRPQAVAAPAQFPRKPAYLENLFNRQQSADPRVRSAALLQARAEAWALLAIFGRMDSSMVNPAASVSHGPLPLWEIWNNKCDLQLSRLCRQELTLAKQNTTRTNPRFSTVRYNGTAAGWILGQHFADGRTFRKQLVEGLQDISPAFPHDSVVIKEIWQSFNTDKNASNVTIPVYDPQHVSDDGTQLPDLGAWTNRIKIQRVNGQIDFKADCELGSYASSKMNSVPINCFVHRVASRHCSDLVQYVPNVKPMQGSGAFPDLPCAAILVGFHIMTRELDNWTWNTFWWSNIVSGDSYRNDRPIGLPQAFTHMAMNTMLSPAPNQPVPPVKIFNPYLEGPHDTRTNCLQCHAGAAYTPVSDVSDPQRGGIANPESNTTGKLRFCTALELAQPGTNHCQIRTAFLWSLATNQDNASTEPPFMKSIVHLPHVRK